MKVRTEKSHTSRYHNEPIDLVATFAVLVGTAMGLGYYLGRKLPNPPANQTQSNIQEPIVNPAEDWKLVSRHPYSKFPLSF